MGRVDQFADPPANGRYLRRAVVRCVVFARLKSPIAVAKWRRSSESVQRQPQTHLERASQALRGFEDWGEVAVAVDGSRCTLHRPRAPSNQFSSTAD